MPVGTVFLGFIIFVALIVAVVAGVTYYSNSNRLGRNERRQLRDQERLIGELRELAYRFRDTDSALSYEITDKINQHQAKELES